MELTPLFENSKRVYMIEINELRIGNLFQDEDNTLCYFAGAWKRADGWVIRDSGNNTYKPMQAYPIPLSPELLEACGFRFVDMMFENAPMQYWRNDWLILHGDEVYIWNDKETQLTIKIKFLHQLQNLCLALTGTELSINLEKVKV